MAAIDMWSDNEVSEQGSVEQARRQLYLTEEVGSCMEPCVASSKWGPCFQVT
jgi:hypothetical protein